MNTGYKLNIRKGCSSSQGVRVDRADLHIEGIFWLALTMGPAFPAPSDMALATDVLEEGWLIVPVKWYKLEDKDRRGYKLLPEVRHIVVNAMIRLGGLHFEGSQGGRKGAPSAGATA